MAIRVVTTSPGFATAGDLADRIAARGRELIRVAGEDVAPALARADVRLAALPAVTASELNLAPRLRPVIKHGAGLDAIDVAARAARGIPVTVTPGANALAVAELAIGQIFALSRHVMAGHGSIVSCGWQRRVGFGRIGQILAAKARALGMEVIGHDPFADPARCPVPLVPLDRLLTEADHLVLHVPGGPGTENLIGAAEIARMKPGACLLNFARGEVLDLAALDAALRAGHLGGAAIDASRIAPPDRAEAIFRNPKVIFTPYSGADTTGALLRMGRMILEDIDTILAGGRPAAAGQSKG